VSIAVLVVFALSIIMAGYYAATSEAAQAERHEEPDILYGMLALIPCPIEAGDAVKYSKRLLIDPNQIVVIGDPPNSLSGCVRIVSPTGRSVYIEGSDEGVARARRKAMRGAN
jgi:hypothetical protein